MRKPMPLLPGFHQRVMRRKPRSVQQKFAEKMSLLKQKSFKQIGELFEDFVPRTLLKPERNGAMSRRRLFSKENTFWAFFSQVLDADGGCKEVIRKLQSYASVKGVKVPSSSTASYCAARKKLDKRTLSGIFKQPPSYRRRWDRSQHARYTGEPKGLAAVVFTKAGMWIPYGPHLRLFFAGKWGSAQLRHGQQEES